MNTCTAADGKTIVYSIPGYPLMVRAVDFNTLFGSPHHAAPAIHAIQFAITNSEGLEFLRQWMHGDWEAIRREWPEAPASVVVASAAATAPAIQLGGDGQKVFAETLLNPPPPTAAFLKAEENYSNLVRPEATAPAGGMTDGAERWMAIVREKADDARKNAHGLRQFEGMEAEARARELAAQYLLETAHAMVLDERHAEALAGIVDQSGRIAELRAALTTAARAAEPAGGVTIDFQGLGTAGPFPVIDGRVTLPNATMDDLAHYLAPTAARAAEPSLWVSPEQALNLTDPEGEGGRYLPARRTPAGKFTMPLYPAASPQPPTDTEKKE